MEGKQINLKGNVFVKSLYEIEARRKKQHQREKNIKSHCFSLMMAERKSAVVYHASKSLQRVWRQIKSI